MPSEKIFNYISLRSCLFLSAFSLFLIPSPNFAQTNNASNKSENNPVTSKYLPESPAPKSKKTKDAEPVAAAPNTDRNKTIALSKTGSVSEKHKIRKNTKTAIQSMSSDDTSDAYFHAVDPEAHLQKAQQLAAIKNYNAALKEVNEALTQNPQFYQARYLGALIYQSQGRYKEAAVKYRHLLFDKPNYLQARIGYGMTLSELGEYKAAEAEYKKALELNIASCEIHYNLANVYIRDSRYKDAIAELKICAQLAPDNAAVHNNLGVVYLHEHNLKESEKEFKLASELDPANKMYLANLERVRSNDEKKLQRDLGWY